MYLQHRWRFWLRSYQVLQCLQWVMYHAHKCRYPCIGAETTPEADTLATIVTIFAMLTIGVLHWWHSIDGLQHAEVNG